MKPLIMPFAFRVAISVSIAFLFFLTQDTSAANIISGTIYDKARNPLPDLDVELLDEYQRTVPNGRQKTTSSGRYEFVVANSGEYYIRVYAFRYDLEDETRPVTIQGIASVTGQQPSSYNNEDFTLSPKKGGLRELELSVIFAQNIPKSAEKDYKTAMDDLSKKRMDEGFAGLQKAIALFPDYYVALYQLGIELYVRKQYLDSAQAFLRAGSVNQKSALAYYNAGRSLSMLDEKFNKSAYSALSIALELAPGSAPVLFQLGKIERKMGKFTDAEKHLLLAKRIAQVRQAEIQKELAMLYANDLKKYKEAAAELEQYLKAGKMSDAEEAKTKQLIADLRAKAAKQPAN